MTVQPEAPGPGPGAMQDDLTGMPSAARRVRPRFRFTIRALMIVIAAVACLMALPSGFGIVALVLSVPILGLFAARRLILGGHRTFATVAFATTAAAINFLYVKACIEPEMFLSIALFCGLLIAIPMIGCLGAASLITSARSGAVPTRWLEPIAIFVFVVTVLPLATVCTVWPLHVNFLLVRPRLDALANQVEAGKAIAWPQKIGPYLVQKGAVNSTTGEVYLFTDPNPSGPSGFVRTWPRGRAPSWGNLAPYQSQSFPGSDLRIDLGWGWSFREDD